MANALRGIQLTNCVVARTDWVNEASGGATPTYEDYPYRADISVVGVRSSFSPDIRLNYNDIVSRIINPICDCSTDVIRIYASRVPDNDVTIPVIICTKVE